MTPRDIEIAMLTRCVQVARSQGQEIAAINQREANVFRLAAMILTPRFPRESENLTQANERYFALRPDDKLAPAEVIRRVSSLACHACTTD